MRTGIDMRIFGSVSDGEAPAGDDPSAADGLPDEIEEEILYGWTSISVFKHGDLVRRSTNVLHFEFLRVDSRIDSDSLLRRFSPQVVSGV